MNVNNIRSQKQIPNSCIMIINNRIITLVTVVTLYIPAFLANAAFARDICMLAHSKCVYLMLNRNSSSSIVAKTGEQKKGGQERKNRVGIERSHQRRDCLHFLPTSRTTFFSPNEKKNKLGDS